MQCKSTVACVLSSFMYLNTSPLDLEGQYTAYYKKGVYSSCCRLHRNYRDILCGLVIVSVCLPIH